MISNTIKSIIFFSILSALLLGIGYLIGGTHGLLWALIISLIINGFTYFFSANIILSMYHAKPLSTDEYPDIHTMVEQLCTHMSLPKPTLWIIDTPLANAFATGRSPHHAHVALTTGILSLLNERELRGVLAHELSHVRNYDILIGSLAAVIASAVGYLSYLARYGYSSNDRRNRAYLPLVIIVGIVVPFVTTLVQLALSRTREYQADETGACACNDAQGLANALIKLHNHLPYAHLSKKEAQEQGATTLFIIKPFLGNSWTTLFSTHPPIGQRIARLEQIQTESIDKCK